VGATTKPIGHSDRFDTTEHNEDKAVAAQFDTLDSGSAPPDQPDL
jgi:hypothetical protein